MCIVQSKIIDFESPRHSPPKTNIIILIFFFTHINKANKGIIYNSILFWWIFLSPRDAENIATNYVAKYCWVIIMIYVNI